MTHLFKLKDLANLWYFRQPEIAGSETAGLEIITAARDELAEALVSVEDDAYRWDAFPHIRLSPGLARAYAERLEGLLDDILHETPDPDGEVYGILISMFKAPAYIQGPSTAAFADPTGTEGED